jgi:hypothetical protein
MLIFYSLAGKFRHRDRILAKVPWAGSGSGRAGTLGTIWPGSS